jgi:hypothetical protein
MDVTTDADVTSLTWALASMEVMSVQPPPSVVMSQ